MMSKTFDHFGRCGRTRTRASSRGPGRWLRMAAALLAVIGLVAAASAGVNATQPANPGFEAGLMGWSIGGNVTTRTGVEIVNELHQWTVAPYQTRLCALTPDAATGGTWEAAAAALLLPADALAYLTGAFADSDGVFAATDFAFLHTDLELEAGESVTLAWNHVSGDALPRNDASAATFVCLDDPAVRGQIDGHPAQVELLGAVQPGTARCATDDYGATGWQTIVFEAGPAGRYRLGMAVFNLTDESRDPWLLVDEAPGTTLCDGTAFSALSPDPAAPLQPMPAVPTPTPTTSTTAAPTTAVPTTATTTAGTTGAATGSTTATTGDPTSAAATATTTSGVPRDTTAASSTGGAGSPSSPPTSPLPPTGEPGTASGATALAGALLLAAAGTGAVTRFRRRAGQKSKHLR